NVAALALVGTFSTTDPDTTSFTYELVAGTGDTDNDAFTIVGEELRIRESPDFENQQSYSIRVQTTDVGGLSYSENFTINVKMLMKTPRTFNLATTALMKTSQPWLLSALSRPLTPIQPPLPTSW
ncbi:MAG: cadherin repeat domain-containing protein, partial [Hormoscilla sp. GM102CHS1]|nr:cadherin repeat domain-containing protein [Hormoscilla sp. GM102CHS1]